VVNAGASDAAARAGDEDCFSHRFLYTELHG
jgi:hypothetical protein